MGRGNSPPNGQFYKPSIEPERFGTLQLFWLFCFFLFNFHNNGIRDDQLRDCMRDTPAKLNTASSNYNTKFDKNYSNDTESLPRRICWRQARNN